jgi:hypothetical protein
VPGKDSHWDSLPEGVYPFLAPWFLVFSSQTESVPPARVFGFVQEAELAWIVVK